VNRSRAIDQRALLLVIWVRIKSQLIWISPRLRRRVCNPRHPFVTIAGLPRSRSISAKKKIQ